MCVFGYRAHQGPSGYAEGICVEQDAVEWKGKSVSAVRDTPKKCTSGAWQGAEVQDACVCWSLSASEFANLKRCRSNSPRSSLRLQLLAHPILSELHNGDPRSRSTTNNIRPQWLTPRLYEVIAFGHALLHIALDRTCRLPSHASVTVRRRQGASCAVQRARFCQR